MANRISRQQTRMNKRMNYYDKNGVDYKKPTYNGGYGNAYTDIQSRQNRINKLQQKQNQLTESIDRIVNKVLREFVNNK